MPPPSSQENRQSPTPLGSLAAFATALEETDAVQHEQLLLQTFRQTFGQNRAYLIRNDDSQPQDEILILDGSQVVAHPAGSLEPPQDEEIAAIRLQHQVAQPDFQFVGAAAFAWIENKAQRKRALVVEDVTAESPIADFIIAATSLARAARRRTSPMVLKENELLKITKEAAKAGIYDYDIRSGTVFWDDRMSELWGMDGSSGVPIDEAFGPIHDGDKQRIQDQLDSAFADPSVSPATLIYRLVHPLTRKRRWIASRAEIQFVGDTAVRMIGSIQDITDLKEIEEQLRAANKQKDEFLAILAHELRNPMAVLSSSLEVLDFASEDPALRDETHGIMKQQIHHLAQLVNDLLDVARYSSDRLELRRRPILLAKAIKDSVSLAYPIFSERNISLQLSGLDEDIYLEADPNRICQIISNLLINAAKFSDEASEVALKVSASKSVISIAIEDNGIGLESDSLQSIFTMFAQVGKSGHGSAAGLGIGLTLARGLAEKHGGTLIAQSEGLGKGSTFTLTLPTLELTPEVLDILQGDQRIQNRKNQPLRVLFADDNPAACYTFATLLKLHGHDIQIAPDGESAVTLAGTFKPQLIILDIGMPVMDGYEACRRIRQLDDMEDTVIVAHSGWGREADRKQSQEAGFNHHLTKPAPLDEIEKLFDLALHG